MREISIDLAAIRSNYLALKEFCAPAKVMAVVKANAYGHGMVEVASALEQVGVDALGVADFAEATALRAAGIKTRIMCWLLGEDVDYPAAAELDIELGISTFEQLEQVRAGTRIHIKIDTGLGRNGFSHWIGRSSLTGLRETQIFMACFLTCQTPRSRGTCCSASSLRRLWRWPSRRV